MHEQIRLMLQHPIQTPVQPVFLRHRKILLHAKRPWRCDRTTAGADETRCPDRSTDSPPAAPAPAARLRFLSLAAVSRTRTDPVATAAIARIPASSCHTAALAPASSR